MKRFFSALAFALLSGAALLATNPYKIVIPDAGGYVVLKGDMHMHTVFSDATVWPTDRVCEAMMEGLDVLAITDHVDARLQCQKNNGLFTDKVDRNTSYEMAAQKAKEYGMIIIRGGEITRNMSPGHFNATFLQDAEALGKVEDPFPKGSDDFKAMMAGLQEARRQGGFLVWNHPNWSNQAPNGPVWYEEHTKILNAGLMDGIEVYNDCDEFCWEAYGWALEKNLALVSGTDSHAPLYLNTDYAHGDHRPVTLFFAKERSLNGVREALDNRRTAIFADGCVWGREPEVAALAEACFKVTSAKVSKDGKSVNVRIKNDSSIPMTIVKAAGSENLRYVTRHSIRPFEEGGLTIKILEGDALTKDSKSIDINLCIENFFVGVHKPLVHTFSIALQ